VASLKRADQPRPCRGLIEASRPAPCRALRRHRPRQNAVASLKHAVLMVNGEFSYIDHGRMPWPHCVASLKPVPPPFWNRHCCLSTTAECRGLIEANP